MVSSIEIQILILSNVCCLACSSVKRGGGRVTVQIVPPKSLSTILLGHKLNVCFSTATTAGAGQFREETLYLEKKKRTQYTLLKIEIIF